MILVSAISFALIDSRQPLNPRDLDPVEQGFHDVEPLMIDARNLTRQLRDPANFEQVYAVPGRDDLFMRIHGGLIAVFPRSVYVPTRRGGVPVIPPGTRFYIGDLPAALLGTEAPGEVSDAAGLRIEPDRATDSAESAGAEPGSIWTDETYRRSRIGELMSRAAGH